MNDLFVTLGIQSWKGVIGALVMPPLPLLVMVLVGMRLVYRRRMLAWSLVLTGVMGTWLLSSSAVAVGLQRWLLNPPRALMSSDLADLKKAPQTVVLVLGGGRHLLSPAYGMSNLSDLSLERLRYGIWLSRQTSLPLAFSGGVAHGQPEGPTEAEIAARITEQEFGHKLKWLEPDSRDTSENASRSLALLHEAGIRHVVLVTHDLHIPRAVAAFARAQQRSGLAIQVTAAPMGQREPGRLTWAHWLPSGAGLNGTRYVLHEWLGRLAGA
jgi:uncharacterized SAM-binding protein YcdF (DUF218 family)